MQRMRYFAWVCAALALQAAIAGWALADEFDGVRDKIHTALVERGVPSVAVAVARDGQIVWEEGFGWADRENRVPASEHTMYSLASISKPITATGLALLVERGRIDLDKPMNDYLGDAKLVARVDSAEQATVRRVANHSAGLPLHYQFFYADEPYRRPAMDETIRRYGNLVTAPGERFQYSNLGYGVIDYVIARSSGKKFADFMREEVFLPLGLTYTSVDIGPGLEKQAAVRYGADGRPIPFYDFDHPGGSAVFASAHDLVRFGMFHAGTPQPDQKQILSAEARKRMQEPTAEIDKNQQYGLGWFLRTGPGGERVVSHSGGMGGVSTLLTLVPERRVVVAVLSNSNAPLPGQLTKDIMAIVNPAPAAKKDIEESDIGSQLTAPAASADEALKSLVGKWKGSVHTYEADLPITMWVQDDGDVVVQFERQLKTLLNGARFRDGWLRGRFASDLGTDDANRTRYDLQLEVKLRGDALNGSLTAVSRPALRVGNALTHWIELRKEAE
ncbi:MAG: beta-lactamase family protein [Planctomycetia bacterium]|nr:beta-lactamase family protein [Planctomycetia bacterium]